MNQHPRNRTSTKMEVLSQMNRRLHQIAALLLSLSIPVLGISAHAQAAVNRIPSSASDPHIPTKPVVLCQGECKPFALERLTVGQRKKIERTNFPVGRYRRPAPISKAKPTQPQVPALGPLGGDDSVLFETSFGEGSITVETATEPGGEERTWVIIRAADRDILREEVAHWQQDGEVLRADTAAGESLLFDLGTFAFFEKSKMVSSEIYANGLKRTSRYELRAAGDQYALLNVETRWDTQDGANIQSCYQIFSSSGQVVRDDRFLYDGTVDGQLLANFVIEPGRAPETRTADR
jgi:hypothetical protein